VTSLLICSRNRPALLEASVHSVLCGTDVPGELIVIDQSDTPNTHLGQQASTPDPRCPLHYRWQPAAGLSAALNAAVAAARFDALLFTHDDVLVDPRWCGALTRALAGAGPGTIVTGRVLPAPDELDGGIVPSTKVDTAPRVFVGRIGDDVLYPLNMAMQRETFNRIGRFDERLGPGTPFPAAEDNDYGFRALEAGGRIEYVPSAVVYHRAWRRDVVRLRWGYGLGQGAFYAKHFSLRDRYMARRAGAELRRYATLAATRALRGDGRCRWYVASAAGLCAGFVRWGWMYRLRGAGAWA
jgi:GT2 family glycosyltransferase